MFEGWMLQKNSYGNNNKKPKLGKNVGVECNLYEARSTKEQMFDTDAIAKMRENLK